LLSFLSCNLFFEVYIRAHQDQLHAGRRVIASFGILASKEEKKLEENERDVLRKTLRPEVKLKLFKEIVKDTKELLGLTYEDIAMLDICPACLREFEH